uniref:NAC domain-containing protein n=1 Tax=Panagrolaimus sp. JU765 TaxID=591449 RepID=A0AC34RMN9_9BILA
MGDGFQAQNNHLFDNLDLNWNFGDGPVPHAGDALPSDPPSDTDERSTDGSEASAHNHPGFLNNGNAVGPAPQPMNNQLPFNRWAFPTDYYYVDPINMRYVPYYYAYNSGGFGHGGQFFTPTNPPLLPQDVVYGNPTGFNNGNRFGFQHAWGNGACATKNAKKGAPKKKGGSKWFCCFKWKKTKGKDAYDSDDEWYVFPKMGKPVVFDMLSSIHA